MSRHREWWTTWWRQTNPFIGYVCFTTSTEKSRILFVQHAMSKNRTILILDQRIEVLCHLGEAHHVESLLPSQCDKTQMARMISKQTRKPTVTYVDCKHSRTVGLQYLSCYVALMLGLRQCVYSLGMSLVIIVVGSIAILRCIIFCVPRLPIRPCDERPPAMYGHFCLGPRVSVHDRYYCIFFLEMNLSSCLEWCLTIEHSII